MGGPGAATVPTVRQACPSNDSAPVIVVPSHEGGSQWGTSRAAGAPLIDIGQHGRGAEWDTVGGREDGGTHPGSSLMRRRHT